jgi:hypothetical protein
VNESCGPIVGTYTTINSTATVRYIDNSTYFFALGMGIMNTGGVEKGFKGTIASFEVITNNMAANSTR